MCFQPLGTADIDEVGAAAKSDGRIVTDVRENARYLGQIEPLDLIAGHIPGASNLFYAKSLGEASVKSKIIPA